MAAFRKGQEVTFRGRPGVVEAVDLTPGMVDVRYGRLTKRHRAGELELALAARSNPRRRRKPRRARRNAGSVKGLLKARGRAKSALRRAEREGRPAHEIEALREQVALLEAERAERDDEVQYHYELTGAEQEEARVAHKARQAGERKERRAAKKKIGGPGFKRKEQVGSRAADLKLIERQVQRGGGSFFVLPDPPRFEYSERRDAFDPKLCGNAIDGSMYILALPARKTPVPHVLTQQEWPKVLLQWQLDYPTKPAPEGRKVVEAVRNYLRKQGYTRVLLRGQEWVDPRTVTDDERSLRSIRGFTRAEMIQYTVGVFEGEDEGRERTIRRLKGQVDTAKKVLPGLREDPSQARTVRRIENALKLWQDMLTEAKKGKKTFSPVAGRARVRRPRRSAPGPHASLLAKARGQKAKELYSNAYLPRNAFFYALPNGRYAVFVGMKKDSASINRLFEQFEPPWHTQSSKQYSPYFSWRPLRRPLTAGHKALYSEPLCITGEQQAVLDSVRHLLLPTRAMVNKLYWMRRTLESSSSSLRSINRTAGGVMKTAAWFGSWLQNALASISGLPKAEVERYPQHALVMTVFPRLAGKDAGLDPAAFRKALADKPLALVRKDPKRKAHRLGWKSHAQAVKSAASLDLGEIDKPVYTARTFSGGPGSLSWDLQRTLEARATARRRASGPSMAQALEARFPNPQDLGEVVAERLARAGMIQPGQQAEKAHYLAILSEGLFDFETEHRHAHAKSTVDRYKRRSERKGGASREDKALLKQGQAELEEAAREREHLQVLRALFFVYHSLGGEQTIGDLRNAMTSLAQVRSDAGRITDVGRSAKLLEQIHDKEDLLKRKDVRGKERRSLEAQVAALRKTRRAMTHGESLRQDANVSFYYTFNPSLFLITRNWWQTGSPWGSPGKGLKDVQKLTEGVQRRLEDVDALGRFGVAMRTLYEEGRGQEELEDAAQRLSRRLGVADLIEAVGLHREIGATPQGNESEVRALMREVSQTYRKAHPDMELLHPGRGGTHVHVGPHGVLGQHLQGVSPEEIATHVDEFEEDPLAYLSRLRAGAEEAMIRRSHAESREAIERGRAARKTRKKRKGAREVGMTEEIETRAIEPLRPLGIPSDPPYTRTHLWSEQTSPSRYPPGSAVAALEHLSSDARDLRSLIQQRKQQLESDDS